MPKELGAIQTNDKRVYWSEYSRGWKFQNKVWHPVRFFGPIWTEVRHEILTQSKKRYYEYCHAWDPENDEYLPNREERCPICALMSQGKVEGLKTAKRFFVNLISKEDEEAKPQRARADWSPIYMIELAQSLCERIQKLTPLNKGFPVTHPEKGAIVNIMRDENAAPADQYSVAIEEKGVPILPEQLDYIVTQKYPDGSEEVVKSDGKIPAKFKYIRLVSNREEVLRGLKMNGYLNREERSSDDDDDDRGGYAGKKQSPSTQKTTRNSDTDFSRRENGRELAASMEMPIQDAPDHLQHIASSLDDIPFNDEEPAPRQKKTEVKATVEAPTPPAPVREPVAEVKKPALTAVPQISANCPTAFGDFAGAIDCFSDCKGMTQCRAQTAKAKTAAKPVAAAKTTSTVVFDEDDDSL